MTSKKKLRPASMFLLELIPSILFFCIASAVCVQFFVKSHLLSRDADTLNYAVNECSAIAEILACSEDIQEFSDILSPLYPNADWQDNTLTIYYDKNFSPCSFEQSFYQLRAELLTEGNMLTVRIIIQEKSQEDVLYELNAKHHMQRRINHA